MNTQQFFFQKNTFLEKVLTLLSLLPLFLLAYGNKAWLGAAVHYPWIPQLGLEISFKIDTLALLFIFLTSIIIPLVFFSIEKENLQNPYLFYSLGLLLEVLLIGFFAAQDLLLFTFLFEAMLIPLYFMINIWGKEERQAASLKFLIYMIAGSTFMLAAVLALYFQAGSFNLNALAKVSEEMPYAKWVCALFILAFAVKTPLFPFHGWLPAAYAQASTEGTILLSALLSKAGIFGFIRVVMKLFPSQLVEWSPILLGLALTGVFYGALAAWKETDFKRLIAYSSLSHVNFILVGLFVATQPADVGAILQAFNHGITIAALFFAVGWLEKRVGTTQMQEVRGLAKFMPHLCWVTLFFVLSSVALPGTNNFVGELLIFFGLFKDNPPVGYWLAALLSFIMVLSIAYMMRFMQKIYFDAPLFFKERWIDLKMHEGLIASTLIFLILIIGIYPAVFLNLINTISQQ